MRMTIGQLRQVIREEVVRACSGRLHESVDPIMLWAKEGYPADQTTHDAILKLILPHMPEAKIRFTGAQTAGYGTGGSRFSNDPHANIVITHPSLLDGEATVARGKEFIDFLDYIKQLS